MKKASLLASAAVASFALTALPALAQTAGPFADVPADHFAYESVEKLRNRGIVIGYPDGTYGGRRAMTRYEFAVAIARLLDLIPAAGSNQALPNDLVRRGDLAGLATKESVDELRRLVTEFQNELTTLGVDIDNIKRRLDGLEGRVAFLENEAKRVRISGAANFMIRTTQRRGDDSFIEYDGFQLGTPQNRTGLASDLINTFAETRVLHDVDLNIQARLSDTATAKVKLNFGNYLPFLTSVSNFEGTRIGTGVNQSQEQTVYNAYIETPIRLPGVGAVAFQVGRIPVQLTPYTLKQIDTDSYFSNEKTDLGDLPLDGGRAVFKLGPVGITTFAAKADPIKYVANINGENQTDVFGYGLYAGATTSPFAGGFASSGRPTQSSVRPGTGAGSAFSAFDGNGAMAVENMAAVRATFGTSRLGTIGGTYLVTSGAPLNGFQGGAGDINRVYVFGGDITTALGPVGIAASYTKSDSKLRIGNGDLVDRRTEDNAAFDIAGSYTFGGINLKGGYREIQPYFAAPGYWGKLGSYVNPVDIKGPYVKADYAFGGGLVLAGEGHFYKGSDTSQGGQPVGLSNDEGITNFKAGLKYGLTSATAVDLGAEYTTYDLGNGPKPREVFYNIGLGYSFNPTTSFKFLYQIADYNDRGTGFDPVNGDGAIAAAQFSVKF